MLLEFLSCLYNVAQNSPVCVCVCVSRSVYTELRYMTHFYFQQSKASGCYKPQKHEVSI